MINLYEIKKKLEAIIIDGEITIDKDDLYWYFEDDLEDQDFLWDVYCDNANALREAGYEIKDNFFILS